MNGLPDGLELVRTTAEFDEGSVPQGLLRAHRVASDTWGRLVVNEGELVFTFDDDPDSGRRVVAGDPVVIPPGRPHHVTIDGRVRFAVEFYVAPR
jgi:tellurite resistance-related uncharacterized protein